MQAWVFFYSLKELDPKIRTKVGAQLYGKKQQSNYGRYHYQITGLMPENSYIRPVKSVVIVKKRYVPKLCKFFEFNRVKYRLLEIIVDGSDFEKKPFL